LKVAYLGFGSNMGDRETNIRRAVDRLESPELRLVRLSSLYETEPIGFAPQRWFLNCAGEFESDLFPRQLLHRLQRVELSLGRRREITNGPRTIDVDILLYGDVTVKTDELQIPHPRFRERRFVLAPLAELNPSLRDPVTGRTVTELLEGVRGQTARRLTASATAPLRGQEENSGA
jgi:2-amino-4-hydroxy-6-hydroxymethyldihydropteridine diphosphokinase